MPVNYERGMWRGETEREREREEGIAANRDLQQSGQKERGQWHSVAECYTHSHAHAHAHTRCFLCVSFQTCQSTSQSIICVCVCVQWGR